MEVKAGTGEVITLFHRGRAIVCAVVLLMMPLSLRPETDATAEAAPPPATAAEVLADLPQDLRGKLVDSSIAFPDPVFANGELLEYRIGWGMFTVASATMDTRRDFFNREGHEAFRVILETRTNRFADAFYKVRNTSTSWFASDVSRGFRYSALQDEGKTERDIITDMYPESNTAVRNDRLKEEVGEPVVIVPGTFDPLSIVFYVRCLDLQVGNEYVIPTTNGKELFFTIVRVTGIVERKFATGRQRAFVVEPDIKDLGGVFKKSSDGSIRFYFSADERKLPLRMESEVSVGSFWAELISARFGPQ